MDKNTDKIKELGEIKASIEVLDKKYRESKGYGECCDKSSPAETEDMMYSMIQGVYRYIDSVQSNFWSWQSYHTDNHTHLPKLTASQTEKLLKAAGADGDFEIVRPVIFAKANRQGNREFEVDLNIKK